LVTEVQRSIGFFRSIDKKAEIGELVVTGNTVKMPGLASYIGKNLGVEVTVLDRFNRLDGDEILEIPSFRDNAPTFAVAYGLCLQALGAAKIQTSLVPSEILTQRLIRAKKTLDVSGNGRVNARDDNPLLVGRTKLVDHPRYCLEGLSRSR
jgi:type IV pilus assembly protein PilM